MTLPLVPHLQTVLTVVSGAAPVPVRVFVWGTPAQPFSVGTRGDWIIESAGVEAVHFYLGFDGRQIYAAAATGAQVLIGPTAIDQKWAPVPVSSTLRFGHACINVTCQPRSSTAPMLGHEARALQALAGDHTPALRTLPLGNLQPGAPTQQWGSPNEAFRAELPARVTEAKPAAEPAQPALPKAAVLGFVAVRPMAPAQPLQPTAPAQPLQPTTPVPSPASPAKAPAARMVSVGAPAPAPAAPAVAPTLAQPGFPAPDSAPSLDTMPSAKRPLEPIPNSGFVTASDAGALRDFASRMAEAVPGLAQASADAQAAPHQMEQRADRGVSGTPGGGLELAPNQGAAARGQPLPPAGWVAPSEPAADSPDARKDRRSSADPDVDAGAAPAKPPSALRKAWRETSWVKKVSLVLLPFAGYFAVLWEPPAAPARRQPVLTGASKTQKEAVVPAPTLAPLAPSGAAASAASSVGASPSAPSALPTASGAGASSAQPALVVPSVSAVASPPGSSAPVEQREALNAAFQGRLAEAARRYETLASGPDAAVYALAARFAREQAVRKP